MSLVAIKGQTRWSLLPLSGIKPYKQRSALVRAYVDLRISIVWHNARLCATINYRWQIQIRWIRIGWTAYFVDYRYRQLPSLSSRQSVRSLRPIETAMMNRRRPTYRMIEESLNFTLELERRFGIIIEFEFYGRFMRDDDVAPRDWQIAADRD